MTTVHQLLEEATQLPEDQRLTLANRLLALSEPPESEETEKAWRLEIRNRISKYDQGQIKTRSADQVFTNLNNQLKK